MRKNIVRKILYTGYIEFFLSIWFWIGAGISMFELTVKGTYAALPENCDVRLFDV